MRVLVTLKEILTYEIKKMQITVKRLHKTNTSTIGELLIDGLFSLQEVKTKLATAKVKINFFMIDF